MIHGEDEQRRRAAQRARAMNRPDDDAPRAPDGPTPAREQLPLPRRRRQAHIDPQLRTPSSTGAGTPFAPFAAEDSGEATASVPADPAAVAFHAGVRRGRDRV